MNQLMSKDRSVEKLMLKDNPNTTHIKEISKYIRALDSRLSIPKFTQDKENSLSPSPQGLNKMRRSINNS